jgi:hypothetical protein
MAAGLLAALLLASAFSVVGAEDEPPPAAQPAPTDSTPTLPADSGIFVQTLCTNCNNADLSVGGMGNEHVAVVCDDMPVAPGLAQVYLLSVMPPTMIDKVAVDKGASQVELEGAAVGGGIRIERREAEPGLVLNAMADAGSFGWTGTRVDLTGRKGPLGGYFVGSWATSDSIDPDGDKQANLPEFDRTTFEGGLDL